MSRGSLEDLSVALTTPTPLPWDGRPSLKGFLDVPSARGVRDYHKSFPEYAPTPLARLDHLAAQLGIAGLYVKDESKRFGLNAFKVLGGSYAMGRYLVDRLGIPLSELSYDRLMDPVVRSQVAQMTFVTATDGNHGRGVAWTASRLGARSVVYMPKGSAFERLENIRAAGAEASITEFNYDEAVRYASAQAQKHGWIMVQDTAWEGYEDIPRWIIQGYSTMSLEAYDQIPQTPTHVFVQAGVGSLATSVTGFFSAAYADNPPVICVVEPNDAACVFKTAQADDGSLHPVTGSMPTIMAGLACGEPCTVGWPYLRAYASHFVRTPDEVSALGMRVLAAPLPGDPAVTSGESGAVSAGLVATLMSEPALSGVRDRIGLDEKSVVLCFSTEGDTDRTGYRNVVWKGAYPWKGASGIC